MLDTVSISNNFFDKRDMDMGFAVKCSTTLEVLMHIALDLNMFAISSPAYIKIMFYVSPC